MESLLPISFVLENKFIFITVIVIGISSYFLLRRDPRVKYYLDKLDGPRAVPVLGNALQFLIPHNKVVPLFDRWFKEHGQTYRIWIGNLIPYAFTCDVRLIEKIITSSDYLEKGKYDYSLFMNWLGTGLLTAPASKWSIRRKMITPSFHFKILEDFVPIFNEQANVMLECLGKDEWDKSGKIFNMYPYITKCTLDIICETAMGKKINAQTDFSNKEYINAVNGYCLKVIQARKLERKQSKLSQSAIVPLDLSTDTTGNAGVYGKQRKAFLDLLLDTADATGNLTDADICEEVDTFMFEGHDTTAVSLGWTILLLAMHPECQKLVHAELDEIFADNQTRDITPADISKMKYLECCIKESLRLYPSVPWFSRQVNTDINLDDGKVIPKGATLFVSVFFVHRLAEHFPEPLKYIPERFSNEIPTKRHAYAYIPFSASSRNCIGQKFALMEEKIILSKLFRNFTVETEETMENLRPLPDVVMRCENGVHVRLRKRL